MVTRTVKKAVESYAVPEIINLINVANSHQTSILNSLKAMEQKNQHGQ